MHDHLVGGGGLLQPGHAGDHVQGVEQEMRVHLTFQHLQPGVLQIFFQCKVPHFLPVQGIQGGQMFGHGMLHLVEGAHQPAHFVLTGHRQVCAGVVAARDAAGRLRQLQQRQHHRPGQHPDEQRHQCNRHEEQGQI